MEQLIEELEQVTQFAVLYPLQNEKGPNRVALVLSKETLAQQGPAKELGLTRCAEAQAEEEEGHTLAASSISSPPALTHLF